MKFTELLGSETLTRDGTSSMARSNVASDFEAKFVEKVSDEMKKSQLPHPKVRHNGGKSIKGLPNVKKFRIEVGVIDQLFKEHGIHKKQKAILSFEPHINKSANRYIKHQFNRMDEAIRHKRIDIFGTISERLLSKSNIFLLMGINHIFNRGYKDRNLTEVFNIARKVRFIANQTFPELEVKRTYIPKVGKELIYGSVRPLGVPSKEGRVYLHLGNVLLSFFLESTKALPENQHGFRPGKGTATSGKHILEKVIKSPNIYEIDFTSYFDSINLKSISKKLLNLGMPQYTVEKLIHMHTIGVNLPEVELMPEGAQKVKKFIQNNQGGLGFNSNAYNIKGVPQGAPTSPVLSTLILTEELFEIFGKYTGYADDVILYDVKKEPYNTEEMDKLGIKINQSKSGGVRKDGKGLTKLKFLGLEFDGELNKLRAKTRNGATLLYDKEDLALALATRKQSGEKPEYKDENEYSTGMNLLASNIFGFVLSRLYSDSGNPEEKNPLTEEVAKKSGKNSKILIEMMMKRYGVKIDLYNSSSFACGGLKDRLTKRLKNLKLPEIDQEWKAILKVISLEKDPGERLTSQALETSQSNRQANKAKGDKILNDPILSETPEEEQLRLFTESYNSQNGSKDPKKDFENKIMKYNYKNLAQERLTFERGLIANKIKTYSILPEELDRHRKNYEGFKWTRSENFDYKDKALIPMESTVNRLELVGLEMNQSIPTNGGKIIINYYGSSSNLFSANYVLKPEYLKMKRPITNQCLAYSIAVIAFIIIMALNQGNTNIELTVNPIYNLTNIMNNEHYGVSNEFNVYGTKLGAIPVNLVDGRTIQLGTSEVGIKVGEIFVVLGLIIITTSMIYDKVMDTGTIIDYADLNRPELRVDQAGGAHLNGPITLEEYVNLEGYIRTELGIQNQLAMNGELWTAMDGG